MVLGIIFLCFGFVLVGFAVGGFMGAPWVPAFKKDIEPILKRANLKKGERYMELGCGDGRLVAAAAKRGALATGYEINPLLFTLAFIRNLGNKNAHIRFGNFWHKDLSGADVVMAFLMPKFMGRLEHKLDNELKSGARFVSYIFPLPDKKPVSKQPSFYIYEY